MRKIIPVLLIVLLVPVGYYMASKGGGSNRVQDLPSGEGIALKLDKSSYAPSDVMILTLLNNANVNATTSYHFKLYRLEEGEWKEVPVNLMFIEIAVVIEPGKSWEQKVKLSDLSLTPGHYRITKKVVLRSPSGDGVSTEVGAEFDVKG